MKEDLQAERKAFTDLVTRLDKETRNLVERIKYSYPEDLRGRGLFTLQSVKVPFG